MRRHFAWAALTLLLAGCGNTFSPGGPPPPPPPIPASTTPQGAIRRLIATYERKEAPEYQGMLTGDFTYEFSNSTDPTLVQQYSTGWFKTDEMESSAHLFQGYTPPGGATLPAATSIDINFAVTTPTDDNSPGVDPVTHKMLATRIDGSFTVPQAGSEPLTYVISNNYNVFYFVRGDSAVGLSSSQPADAQHWYVYKWIDLSEASPGANRAVAKQSTWGSVKGTYR
jgi:hypothetical protein